MSICIMKLELYVLLRLCQNEVCVDVEHASMWDMNEGVKMYRIYCFWNGGYVQGVLTFTLTHTLINEWSNWKWLRGVLRWKVFMSFMKCLVETSPSSKRFRIR